MASYTIQINQKPYTSELRYVSLHTGLNERPEPSAIRCPHCGVHGTFVGGAGEKYGQVAPVGGHKFGYSLWLGVRPCPNPACGGPVFLMLHENRCLVSYPPQVLDFDASDVPESVASCLSEAIVCHAHGCYKAAAIMVRKSLEALCEDQGANGNNLKARIANLGTLITLPQPLLEAMDHMRLLGNDAAHIDAKTYNAVSQAEVEAAIALVKEIVKAAYQYAALLGSLKALQQTAI